MKKALVLFLCVMFCFFIGCKSENTVSKSDSSANTESLIGMPNPMVKTDENGFLNQLGFTMALPEGATDAQYFIIDKKLADMRFNLNGMEFTARMQSDVKLNDISGMYYDWEFTDSCKISYCEGKILRTKDGENTVEVCLWYDAAPGFTYSLSTVAKNLDGFDITAIAQQVFKPMQGDAG